MNREKTLVLNPTENFSMNIKDNYEILEGFYVSDEIRDGNNKIIFAGRNSYTKQLSILKNNWCKALNAEDIDLRFLSGLHAHIITFMSLGNIGDTILLLPENAGGHYSTEAILKRLGYNVICAIPNNNQYCVDIDRTQALIKKYRPKFIFIDRSEGLYYEDFSWVKQIPVQYCIFDGSQYLSQIISKTYPSPFDFGFDLLLSSTHKNYPGPQKAFLASKKIDMYWQKIKDGSATYISNSHPKEMFQIAESISNIEKLKEYSNLMIDISDNLENFLSNQGFPVINKDTNKIHTQHIWATFKDKDECFKIFCCLEQLGLYTNYRLLPYNLGYGLRIGVGAAIQQGLRVSHVEQLSKLMVKSYKNGYSKSLKNEVEEFLEVISQNGKFI